MYLLGPQQCTVLGQNVIDTITKAQKKKKRTEELLPKRGQFSFFPQKR